MPLGLLGQAGQSGKEEAAAAEGGEAPETLTEATQSIVGTLQGVWADFVGHLPFVVAGFLLVLLTWLVALMFNRFSSTLLGRLSLRRSLRDLLSRLVYLLIWVLGLLISAMVVFPGVTPGKALAALGLGSVAIGFAFKDIFENFFAGVLILWRFPFETDDFIECQGILGRVEDVTIRNTLIRKTTGELVIIPNAMLFKNSVDVLTDLPHRRVTVICGVAYDEDIDPARDVIEKAVEGCSSVAKDKPIEIFAQEFAASSINFEVTWWCEPRPRDVRASRDEVVAAVKGALDDAGIEIPFPYRTLTFKGEGPRITTRREEPEAVEKE